MTRIDRLAPAALGASLLLAATGGEARAQGAWTAPAPGTSWFWTATSADGAQWVGTQTVTTGTFAAPDGVTAVSRQCVCRGAAGPGAATGAVPQCVCRTLVGPAALQAAGVVVGPGLAAAPAPVPRPSFVYFWIR